MSHQLKISMVGRFTFDFLLDHCVCNLWTVYFCNFNFNFFFFAGIDNWIRSRKKIQDMDQKKPTIQSHANRTEEELRNQDAAAYGTTPPREEQTRLT